MYYIHRVKMNCVNCGDQIGNERNSDDKFCSDQCKVEYELEHNRKWKIFSFEIPHIANK
jgi:predicted nucleic acid-binding Zn ribbon protein